MSLPRVQWDGHSHTEYCGHGSGEPTEAMVERAIDQGFTTYSITEHAPLPPDFVAELPYPRAVSNRLELDPRRVNEYLAHMARIRTRYRRHIDVKIGFELDYLPQHVAWTRSFLDRVARHIDDLVLSVHFVPTADGMRGIDLDGQELKDRILPHYGSFAAFQIHYLDTVQAAVRTDFGTVKPQRLAHLTRCRMFQRLLPDLSPLETAGVEARIANVLHAMRAAGFALEFNVSGLDHADCADTYPPRDVALRARALGLRLVYGSDAHRTREVGRHYHTAAASVVENG
ncbi:MAG: histidinol-phosphatase HisJ [Clostridia bacterium]